ncbi:MAG: hypothetical protein AAGM67_08865, partial [Bacteroidota bacterium]
MNVVAFVKSADLSFKDFIPDEIDVEEIKTHASSGLRSITEPNGVLKFLVRKTWRTCVPHRTRVALINNTHGTKHAGERALTIALSNHFFKGKRGMIREFLQNCRCNAAKSDGNPRNESKESAVRTSITAANAFDIVQVDVYDYDGVHYLTAIDLKTGKAFARRICRVGQFPSGSLRYTNALHSAYMVMESSMPRIPKTLRCDNETALKRLPHDNVVPGPVHYPQTQSKVERLHKELAKLCRIHKCSPDVAVNHYNVAAPSGGGDAALAISDHDHGLVAFSNEHYKGRELKVGDLVFKKAPARSRLKSDDYWHDLSRVTERVGAKTYHVFNGKRITLHNIDALKNFSLGENLIKDLKINPEFVAQAEEQAFHERLEDFDHVADNFEPFEPAAHDGDVVWLGFPGRAQMGDVATFLAEQEFRVAYLIAPELK